MKLQFFVNFKSYSMFLYFYFPRAFIFIICDVWILLQFPLFYCLKTIREATSSWWKYHARWRPKSDLPLPRLVGAAIWSRVYIVYFTGCLFDKKRARLRFKLAFLHEFFKIKTYHKNIELYNFAFVEYFKRKFLYYFDEKIRFIRSWFREQEIYNHP